jgi:hypothetical protein
MRGTETIGMIRLGMMPWSAADPEATNPQVSYGLTQSEVPF